MEISQRLSNVIFLQVKMQLTKKVPKEPNYCHQALSKSAAALKYNTIMVLFQTYARDLIQH